MLIFKVAINSPARMHKAKFDGISTGDNYKTAPVNLVLLIWTYMSIPKSWIQP